MIQQCALNVGFIKWMAGRQQQKQSTSKCAPSMGSNCVSLYTIARGTSATSPEPVLPPLQLENGWIRCRYMYYKYGVVVIDLELGMFLEYSRIGSCIGNYYKKCMTTKTPKKGRSCTMNYK